jgi:predicted RNase H-like HicB family nuclease
VVDVSYRVVLTPDETGAWIAEVPEVPGCHTHGRTLEQARRRIREALSLWVENAGEAVLVEDVSLPRLARTALRRSKAARAVAERERTRAQSSTRDAARLLVHDLRLGLRDAGELLELSHQRVQQLVRELPVNREEDAYETRR